MIAATSVKLPRLPNVRLKTQNSCVHTPARAWGRDDWLDGTVHGP